MKSLLFQLFLPIAAHTQTLPAIQLNQVGFYPNAPKLAVVTGNVNPSAFYVVSQSKKDTVYKGTLSTEKRSAFSSIKTRWADFSPLTKEGVYILIVPGISNSHPGFVIVFKCKTIESLVSHFTRILGLRHMVGVTTRPGSTIMRNVTWIISATTLCNIEIC